MPRDYYITGIGPSIILNDSGARGAFSQQELPDRHRASGIRPGLLAVWAYISYDQTFLVSKFGVSRNILLLQCARIGARTAYVAVGLI